MYIFPCKRIRYIKPIAINTHIDCLNNSKCSVRYIFKATKQWALKVTLHHFLLTSKENKREEHPKMMEVSVASQQMDTAMESELVSKTTTKIVDLDHMKGFQECLDTYKIGNVAHSFNMIALANVFYESTCNIHLVVTKSSAYNHEQYSYK